MEYINDSQIIEEASKELIERHLQWSNSLDGKPSDYDGMRNDILRALIDYNAVQAGGWENVTKEEKDALATKAQEIFNEAADTADKKWQAMMLLLGMN